MFKKIYLSIIAIGVFIVQGQYVDYTTVKEIQTKNKGVVVSAHPLASEVGAKMLRMGGNAFDAAIATQYALAVVYPEAGNIGGGGFLVAVKKNGNAFALDYRETAPLAAHRDMYLDKDGQANTNLSQVGRLSVGVPGSVAGFFATHAHAKLPMATLIEPAIQLAEKGFAITQEGARMLNSAQKSFEQNNHTTTAFQKAKKWKAGDILVQPELAQTLKRIQKWGKKGFYEGKTAQLIVEEMKRGNGIISLEDLKQYKAIERKVLRFPYKNHEVISMPLPSSGGILLAQMLTMSSNEPLSSYEPNSPEAIQIMVEAEKRAFADRAKYMGDPDFIEDKTALLLSDTYLKQRWQSYEKGKASSSASVGEIITTTAESKETTHISILDSEGNAVAITTTLNGNYGSKVVVAGAGFLLNNEMDDFSIKPGVPNMFGAVGGEANAIQPRKRMLSSMSPTILLKNGKICMVVGTPGGTTIPTSVFQSIVNVIDFKMSPNMTVNSPKFHHQWLPETILFEQSFPKSTIQQLSLIGYKPEYTPQIGRTEMIVVHEAGNIHAVADGRGEDSVGVE